MKIKIQHLFNGEIKEEDIRPIFTCKHVEDTKLYPSLKDVKFDNNSEFILVENTECPYGFSTLWLKDRKNKVYEYSGFGNSGASSVICSLLQENMKLKEIINNYDKLKQEEIDKLLADIDTRIKYNKGLFEV